MHFVRGLTALGASFLLLFSVQASLLAQTLNRPAPTSPQPADGTPLFTQLLTVTLETNIPTATALFSRWENTFLGFPVGPSGIYFSMATPTDSTEITASVQHGNFDIVGTTVYFSLTESSDFSWSYRTAQKARRIGNQIQIDQFARSNNFYRYVGTIFVPPPYQYVGTITMTPHSITSDTLHWDLIVPQNTPPDRHVFNTNTWLADPRLARPDLSFTAAAVSIDTDLNPPIAHLTTTLRNNNASDITSTIAFLEFYDRATASTPPTSPLDHVGGWCGSTEAPTCPSLATFANPVPSLAAGEHITFTFDYPLLNPGVRDYYWQIDTFGGDVGTNLEANELNNVYTLAQGITIDYLAGVAISGPLTGTAQTQYGFDALISPTLAASRPLTYTWLPTPISGQGTAHAEYAWNDGYSHVVTVTAHNEKHTTVTGTHQIAVEVPLSSVSITGPITVSQQVAHTYQASTLPLTATQPVIYVWDPVPSQGQYTALATYTFATVGEHIVTVAANNSIGSEVTVGHSVVSVPPLMSVTVAGPTVGEFNTTLAFTATTDPAEAAPPVSYNWSPAPASGQGTRYATYLWPVPGTRQISVTAQNDSGPVMTHLTIVIKGNDVYLPLIRK